MTKAYPSINQILASPVLRRIKSAQIVNYFCKNAYNHFCLLKCFEPTQKFRSGSNPKILSSGSATLLAYQLTWYGLLERVQGYPGLPGRQQSRQDQDDVGRQQGGRVQEPV